MPCTLEGEIGRGSNAIVYRASYPDQMNRENRHIVLIKELFPFHRKGCIYRDEQDNIVCEPAGLETMDIHRRSFTYGNDIHLRMLAMHPEQIGANLNTFSLHGTSYTVLGYTGGRALDQEITGEMVELRQIAMRLLGLLDALEAFHESGFLHLDISPDNILLIGQGAKERVILIDYNSVAALSQSTPPTYYSIKQGFSAPEIRTGRPPAAASDLYAVTAVFFHCLTGKPLTPFQASRPVPPDVSGCECLRDMPDTVVDMVNQILRRGLQVLPQKRYQSVPQMREAFQELLDRIDGVGVTHWAIWEGGRRIVSRVIRENPALEYIRDRESLFPANVLGTDGSSFPVDAYIQNALLSQKKAAVLLAPGGMGKTTALLRAVVEQSSSYCSSRPAALYISLYGWTPGDGSFIHNRILENLRFKREQRSFEDARHALELLMDEPLQTRYGERPVLLLLLDGLNEAVGETQPLIEEIRALSRLRGVSILVTTRSEESSLPFPHVCLEPLTQEEVSKHLARYGLLPPEVPVIRELLRTPLMLSIFLRSSLAGERQLSVQTREELIEAYFSALLTKECKALPVDAEARWQIETALFLVLPAIAGELKKRGRVLEDRELLPVIERCYHCFSSRLLQRTFPQWIGHSKAIRGQTSNAEEWYGLIVHDILWKRLGLLVRNEQNTYQISHQIIAEYLTELDHQNQALLWKRRKLGLTMLTVALFIALLSGLGIYDHYFNKQPYRTGDVEDVLTFGLNGYMEAGRQYESVRDLLDCAVESPERYQAQVKLYTPSAEQTSVFRKGAESALERLLANGEVMPGTREPLEADAYRDLISLSDTRREEYAYYVQLLTYVMEDERAHRLYYRSRDGNEGFPDQFSALIEIDADISCALYRLVCEPYAVEDGVLSPEVLDTYQKILGALNSRYSYRGEASETDAIKKLLPVLYQRRKEALEALAQNAVISVYHAEEGS